MTKKNKAFVFLVLILFVLVTLYPNIALCSEVKNSNLDSKIDELNNKYEVQGASVAIIKNGQISEIKIMDTRIWRENLP
jgi:CubicO group peptidase (beta-lactamase class C family)